MSGLSRCALWIALAAACLSTGAPVIAQDFPSKPIRIVVANSAGTIGDLAARLLGVEMTKILGQPIIVEARPGANQLIGLEYVVNLPADGYTTVLSYVSPMATLPVTVKGLRFDPLKDLRPITTVFAIKTYLVASRKQPWSTFNEMVAYARANPGKLNYGSNNLSIRLVLESMFRELGLNIVHVPYTGAGPLIQAVATDQIQLVITNEANLLAFKDSIYALAITGDSRLAKYPDLPTLKELGLPQMRDAEYTLSVRSGTPRPVVDRLYRAILQALKSPALLEGYAKLNFETVADSPESAAKKLAEEAAIYADIAKKMGIRPE